MDDTHGPLIKRTRHIMNALARVIDETLEAETGERWAFVLLVAPFDEPKDPTERGKVNYISNGERESILAMMKKITARFEGRYVV